MNDLNIHIPNPCHEDWNKMTNVALGKHCNLCQTNVIDFSAMSAAEIAHYLKQHQKEKKLCVKIKNPNYTASNLTANRISNYSKKFLYALAIAFLGFIASPISSNAEYQTENHPTEKSNMDKGIFGRIINKSGKGIGNTKVAIFKGEERIAQVRTDSAGYYSLTNAPIGKYTIAVKAPHYKIRSKKISFKGKMKRRNFILKEEPHIIGCPRF